MTNGESDFESRGFTNVYQADYISVQRLSLEELEMNALGYHTGDCSLAPPFQRPLHDRFAARLAKLAPEEQSNIDAVLRQVVSMMEAGGIDAAPMLSSGPLKNPPEEVADFLSTE